jgi:hypothetical protein
MHTPPTHHPLAHPLLMPNSPYGLLGVNREDIKKRLHEKFTSFRSREKYIF